MSTEIRTTIAEQARQIYNKMLKERLEETAMSKFVAIEPVSGDYFLGDTLSEAIGAARLKHPDRLSHAMRVGRKAAVEFGIRIA